MKKYFKQTWCILRRLMVLAWFIPIANNVKAQELTVKGIISGADGKPLTGVNVFNTNTNKGTSSDVNGIYSINAKKGNILTFSFVGMEDRRVTVTGTSLNISLKAEASVMDEVVVIGYGKVKKKELTGAVSSIKAEELDRVVSSDLGSALQGQVAGLNVISSSGAPGATSEILIRGVTTVAGSNTPLFVVDGIPQLDNPNISINEIETIDVLKDAASTAIYGSRGAAGVILITTKQGKAGTLKVSVSGSSGFQHITSRAAPLMNAAEQTYFDIISAQNSSSLNIPIDQVNLGFQVNPNLLIYDTDLSGEIIRDNQPVHNYSLNVNGGTKELSYSVAGGFFQKKGILLNSDYKRYNLRANTRYNHGKWDINANVGVQYEVTNKSPANFVTQIIKYSPTQGPLPIDPNEIVIVGNGGTGTIANGALESLQNKSEDNTNKTFTNISVAYELIKNLKISTRLGYTTVNDYGSDFNPFQQVYDVFGTNLSPLSSSSVEMSAARRKATSWELIANYNVKFNKNVLTFTTGTTYENYFLDRFSAKGLGVLNNNIRTLSGTSSAPTISSGPNSSTTLLGSIFRVQYDLDGRYHLSSSVRRDGSSKFSQENRWGIFPSVGAAWNVSDEAFFEPLKGVINDFKFRATYGTVGNQSFGDYNYAASISSGYDYGFGLSGNSTFAAGGIQTNYANPQVKWETSIQANIGVDLSLLHNRLTVTAEVFDKRNKDMLFPIGLPGSTGGNTVILNVGNMTNKGVEISTGYRMKIKKLNVKLNGIFSANQNIITKINGLGGFLYTNDNGLIFGAKAESQITTLAEGYEAGAFFLYRTDGVVDTKEKLAAYQKLKPASRMGDLMYRDSNGDGIITDADRQYSGSGLPKYEVGLNLNADYNDFDFSMNWYSAIGQEIMNGSKATAYGYGRHHDLLYAWSVQNPDSPIPSFIGDVKRHDNYKGYTDLWLENGNYIRLKQVTLGYSLPKRMMKKMKLSNIRFYISAQNPLTLTRYTGFDPEVGGGIQARGLDKGNYPNASFYLAGINLNF